MKKGTFLKKNVFFLKNALKREGGAGGGGPGPEPGKSNRAKSYRFFV
jgi:hypothetical protein